ncbi:lipoprotein-releasing ABC transporter permease subunit [Marinobacterium weihaiense]|uniref:Lipoprotein-releasing ABC transporter permease subunit n=1 Tax=Marinobacterium weihaiense TaxID=2851016 RepID=A0ABS6M791_9GAMM|nr:lipoprotein-releasing ABC transporter permease subunit [Marinobacterium weihaiense]MBV0932153.1 lipoprotein-releasing ABC transporter permease subunit [Marinobacterium weihaiense]
MFKPLSIFVGLRYTAAKRGNHFISFISLVSMLGLMLGVAALIVVLSVMNGFDRELRQRILGMVPHATLSGYADQGLEDWPSLRTDVLAQPGVAGAAPFVQAQGMLTSRGRVQGVLVNGIDPELEPGVSIIGNHMQAGELSGLAAGEYGIVLGELLARFLGVDVGDKVTLVLPEASISVAGVVPRLKRFNVIGIFSVGAELDANLAYIHRVDAARLKRMPTGHVDGLRLKFDDLFQAPQQARDIARSQSRPLYVNDWTRTHGNLFQAIQMEKRMIALLLLLIVFVAAFNIVSTLVMVVTDKRSDIAILRTMGATPAVILRVFMVQGILIGLIGTALGVALGVTLALTVTDLVAWIEQLMGIEFLSADVYFISYLPSQLIWSDVIMITSAALAISFVATLYPAWRASRTQPAEALRYE